MKARFTSILHRDSRRGMTDLTTAKTTAGSPDIASWSDPFALFASWHADAKRQHAESASAMTLSTVDGFGRPAARIVQLRSFPSKLGEMVAQTETGPEVELRGFAFGTNTGSAKAEQLARVPFASLTLLWFHADGVPREVRVDGPVVTASDAQCDAAFARRRRDAQVGEWVSQRMGSAIADAVQAEADRVQVLQSFADESLPVPRPPFWKLYHVIPDRMEFWEARVGALNDRVLFTRATDSANAWISQRLMT
ncbi:hypothetical protein BC830DRAFT_1150962 [Chytriomyces sp. MP71]|nr:hypothetical protein BC830DRAFT_1150962 [Chytriomyces sp. MP71]